MRWVAWMLAGPTLWAVLFATVYALHGLGCARGWPAIGTPFGNLHVTVMAAIVLTGLAFHALLFAAVPGGQTRSRRLPRLGAWIGLGASILTLSPVVLASTCG